MEKPEGAALPMTDTDQITAPVHPYSIVTVRIDYPHQQLGQKP
jgi:hypothetical protein